MIKNNTSTTYLNNSLKNDKKGMIYKQKILMEKQALFLWIKKIKIGLNGMKS